MVWASILTWNKAWPDANLLVLVFLIPSWAFLVSLTAKKKKKEVSRLQMKISWVNFFFSKPLLDTFSFIYFLWEMPESLNAKKSEYFWLDEQVVDSFVLGNNEGANVC